MNKVFKYTLDFDSTIKMPEGAKILTAQKQGFSMKLWALVDPKAIKEERRFIVVGTGCDLNFNHKMDYIATIQVKPIVWHVFEVLLNDKIVGICDCGCDFIIGSEEFQKLHVGVKTLEAQAAASEAAEMQAIHEDESPKWSDLD